MFVSSTVRLIIIRMSTMGSGTRSSTSTHATSSTAATPKSPRIRPEVQPQFSPSVRARRNATNPPERSAAPGTSMRDGVLIGDSGTNRITSRIASAIPIEPKMNSQRHDRLSTITPLSTIPNPPPTPNTELTRPMRDADLLRWELVADDRERQREHRAPAPGERAERDQRPDVPRERAADAAERGRAEADHEQPLLAVLVAELAEDRRRDRRDEQEDREHPRRPGRRRVELALEHRQRRHDHRLLERERGPRERQTPRESRCSAAVGFSTT